MIKFYYFFLRSGIYDNTDFIAFITSSFDTGPTVIYDTGTFCDPKYSSNAYNDPKVDAATPTPKFSNLIFFLIFSY